MAKRSVKSPEISENRPKIQGVIGHEQKGFSDLGKKPWSSVAIFPKTGQKREHIVRARIPNERRARENGRGRPRARAQNPQNPLRERAKMAGIFPDFLARDPKVGPILEKSPGFFPISSRARPRVRPRARTKVSFFWVGCEDGRGKPLRAYPIIWR